MKFSYFTLFGYQLRQRISEMGGPTYPKFSVVTDLSLVLAKFVFDFR